MFNDALSEMSRAKPCSFPLDCHGHPDNKSFVLVSPGNLQGFLMEKKE